MFERLSSFVTRHPWPIIVVFFGISIFFAAQLPKAEVEGDVKAQLPADFPSLVTIDEIEEIFGGTDMIMIVLTADDVLATDTLKRTKAMSRKLKRVKGVDKVLSLFELKDIRGEDGSMIVDPAVKSIPKSEKRREKLRANLKKNDLVYGKCGVRGL